MQVDEPAAKEPESAPTSAPRVGSGPTDGGPSCRDLVFPATGACLLTDAPEDTPLTLQLAEDCSSLCSSDPVCTVQRDGNVIRLALRGHACNQPSMCDAACKVRATTCELGALAAGDYTVQIDRPSHAEALEALPLHVGATPGSGVSTCTVVWSRTQHEPAPGYSTACNVDADCTSVPSGELCDPCECHGVAMATSEAPAYLATRSEARNSCPHPLPQCVADCILAPARCNAGTCVQ